MLILILEVLINTFGIDLTSCTVGGSNYMDHFISNQYQNIQLEVDPCNPPYWYPRYIPEYCLDKTTKKPKSAKPLPVPIPIPHPIPLPPIYPIPKSYPISLNYPLPHLQKNVPIPIVPQLSMNPAMPAPNVPYHLLFSPQRQIGMVPGLPGIVSSDGGINILPFSDAYSDLLEKQKNRIIRKRMKKIFRDYKTFTWRKHHD